MSWAKTHDHLGTLYYCTMKNKQYKHYYLVSLEEVQAFATRWMWTCNDECLNMALGGITPKQRLAVAA